MTKSTNFNYYEVDNVYGALFFQFPKVLMYGEQYKHLSSDAKLAYMVLKDRLEYSLRNHWVDEEDHVYFIFTNQELINLFNCSEHKVIKIKAELKSAGLLLQKQMGFNPKTKKNEPNRLYLSKLDIKATDVYLRGEYGQKKPETLATSGTAKNAVNLYKDFKNIDTNRYGIDTQKLDFSTANFSPAEIEAQNRDLVKHANDFLTDEDSGLPVFLEPELKPLSADDLSQLQQQPPVVFTSQQHQAGLNYLLGKMELKDIQDHRLQRVLKHDGTRQLFIGECGQDPKLDHQQIEMVQTRLKQQTTRFDQYKQDQIKDYQAINYYPTSPKNYLTNILDEALMTILYAKNTDYLRKQQLRDLKETEWKMTKKQRQHQTRNRHEDGGMHL